MTNHDNIWGPPSPLDDSIYAAIGQLLALEMIANAEGERWRAQCDTTTIPPECVEAIRAETAAVCWRRSYGLLLGILRERRGRR